MHMCEDLSVQFFVISITIPDMTEFFPNEINSPYGIERILLPFIMKKHDELKLEKSHPMTMSPPPLKLEKSHPVSKVKPLMKF